MFRHLRPVRFADVDAVRIVFFPRYLEYCHEALEALFDGLAGGYARLTLVRDVGIPTVHLSVDYRAPLRYGDTAAIDVSVTRLGTKSITFRHVIQRTADGVACAEIQHTVVTARLSDLRSIPLPDDVRDLLSRYVPPG